MTRDQVRALYSGVAVGYVIIVAVAILARDFLRERARVQEVVSETTAALVERADEIAAKTADMIASEHHVGAAVEDVTDA